MEQSPAPKSHEPIVAEEFEQLLAASIDTSTLPNTIAIALSGGADSMALCLLAQEWCLKHNKKLIALTVDHQLRDASHHEALQIASWLEGHHITHHILTIPQAINTNAAIQHQARLGRYNAMTNWCKKQHISHLLVAHHADDQLETFLLRLIGGSGLSGLTAIKPTTDNNNITLLRPLLSVSKDRLIQTLKDQQQDWIEDESNASDRYTRNRIRKITHQLKEEGLSAKRFTDVIQKLTECEHYITQSVHQWISTYISITKRPETNSYVCAEMPLNIWHNAEKIIAERALQQLLCGIGGRNYPVRSEKIASLYDWLKELGTNDNPPATIAKTRTLAGCFISPSLSDKKIYINQEKPSN